MNNKNTPKNNADTLQTIKGAPSHLANETLEHANEVIQEQVRLATEKIEQEKNTFINRLRAWISVQLSRISNTIIALLAATLMTVAMPYLVKLEMDSKLTNLTSNLTGLVTASVSEQVRINAQSFNEKDIKIETAISTMQLALKEVQANASNDQFPVFTAQLNDLKIAQSSMDDKVAGLVKSLQLSHTSSHLTSKSLHSKINRYIKGGTLLLGDNISETDIKNWLGEVYYFVSIMKLDWMDLSTTKQSLRNIYLLDKPLVSEDPRIKNSLIILRVLNDWLKLSPH